MKNSIDSFFSYIENSFIAGQEWITRCNLSIITRGLRYVSELSLIKSNECIAYFEYNNQYDLVLVDSTNQRYQWELWLSPRNSGFLAKLVYSVKHDQRLSTKKISAIAKLVEIKSKQNVSSSIDSNMIDYVDSILDRKRIRTVSSQYDLYLVKSVRNRLDLSRVYRESILGRSKMNHWDKVSL